MKKQKKEITLRDIETMYGNEGTRVAELQSRLALVPEWLSVFLNEQEKSTDFTNQVDDPQLRFQGLHHQFIASAKAVQLAHEIDPDYKVGNMMIYATSYPLTCDPDDIIKNQQQNHIMNYFCSDVQCRGYYPTYMKRYFKENNIEVTMEPDRKSVV